MSGFNPARPTWLEINRNALINNVHQLRKLLAPSTLLTGVVKGNAYGHGAVPTKGSIGRYLPWLKVQAAKPPGSAGEDHRASRAMETRRASMGSSPEKLPLFGWGDPNRTPGKMDKPLQSPDLETG